MARGAGPQRRTMRAYAAVPLRHHYLPHLPPSCVAATPEFFVRGGASSFRAVSASAKALVVVRASEHAIGEIFALCCFGVPYTTSPASPRRGAQSFGDGGDECRSLWSLVPGSRATTATRFCSQLHRQSCVPAVPFCCCRYFWRTVTGMCCADRAAPA